MERRFKEIGRVKLHPIRGELEIWKTDLVGKIEKIAHIKNDIVDGGEIWVAELLAGEEYGGSTLSYSAGELGYGLQYSHIGYGTNPTTQGMYSLQSVSGITTNTVTVDNDVDTPGNKIISRGTYATDEAISNTDLTEAGVFSSSATPSSSTDTASRMFNRTTFPPISKDTTSDYSLTLQWTITIGTV